MLHRAIHEVQYPATTRADVIAHQVEMRHSADAMTVVFSTHHSIAVLNHAQQEFGLADFDLIVCDEAHRTTGATYEGDEESSFVRVHDAEFIRASKRLYMTATPRIYADSAKATAEHEGVELYSMDNGEHYGEVLHIINFSEAVERDLLVDYKVLILTIDESHVNRRLQELLADDTKNIKVDDAADANDWAVETMGDAKYPLDLFQRVITVSLKSLDIVEELPGLEV